MPTDGGEPRGPAGRAGGRLLSLRDLPALPGDLPSAVSATALGGGVSRVWRATLADGADVVVKTGPTDATFEAEGLEALRAAGGPVPAVLSVDREVLVVEHVTGRSGPAPFGRVLAGVHATTSSVRCSS